MRVKDLLKIASKAYPDGLNQKGDSLSKFIWDEIKSTYDPNASNRTQCLEIVRALGVAIQQLRDVARAFRFTGELAGESDMDLILQAAEAHGDTMGTEAQLDAMTVALREMGQARYSGDLILDNPETCLYVATHLREDAE